MYSLALKFKVKELLLELSKNHKVAEKKFWFSHCLNAEVLWQFYQFILHQAKFCTNVLRASKSDCNCFIFITYLQKTVS